jgi:SAM-dependent methyltransferase
MNDQESGNHIPTQSTRRRTGLQKIFDFISFPVRAFTLFHYDRFSLSSLATERFDYVAREVTGRCLDVGCGYHNRFIREFCGGHGSGIDCFPYKGLTQDQIQPDLSRFPFADESFDSATFIANINHVPKADRITELKEAWRCLKPGGRIILTMGNPIAEILVHKLVWLYDRYLKTSVDMDTERGMREDESYFLAYTQIKGLLGTTGFRFLKHKRFITQWGLNSLFVGIKD